MKVRYRSLCGLNKIIPAIAAAAAVLVWSLFHPFYSIRANETADYTAMAEEIIILVNQARAEAGLEPLYAAPVLMEISDVRVSETVEIFSHIRPDGSGFNSALDERHIKFFAAAENIAAGNSTAEATFEQWRNSPGHWKSIMNENYTHIGVGVTYSKDTQYKWYWEQVFIASYEDLEGQYLPEHVEVAPVSYGDIDCDGQVTTFDLILLRQKLNGEVELNKLQLESADCMQDGVITTADAAVLRKYLMNIYENLPVNP